jgi:hypothetical protein
MDSTYQQTASQLGEVVLDQAEALFESCGYAEDFCVQFIGHDHAIFGGANRVIWTPAKGFHPLRGSCTTAFLQRCEAP